MTQGKILKFERVIFSNFENPPVSSLQILLKKIQNATSKRGCDKAYTVYLKKHLMTEKLEMIVPEEVLISKIFHIRDHNVMLDEDLANLYEVETKQLKRQVRRNIDRFPDDFMFELNREEFENLRSQIGASSWGGARYMPMAFTEQGVAMLSSVLNSARAIKVNIQIIRIFTRMREMLLNYKDIQLKL